MDAPRFDALTKLVTTSRSRRAVLGTALASLAGAGLATTDARNGRRRRAHDTCGKHRRCRGSLTCAGTRCCRPHRVFVHCPPERLCTDSDHCCAAKREVKALCCPKSRVCGDFCCGPDSHCLRSDGGPRCACTNDRACPPGYACTGGDCVCQLPPNQCGAGGIGFVTVRRPSRN